MVQKNTQDIEEGAGIFLKLKKEIKNSSQENSYKSIEKMIQKRDGFLKIF